jgi:amphi-Trp domain-containing protein
MAKNRIHLKGALARDRVLGILDDLSRALARGDVLIRKKQKGVRITPRDTMTFVLDAEQKKARGSVNLSLKWSMNRDKTAETLDVHVEPAAASDGKDAAPKKGARSSRRGRPSKSAAKPRKTGKRGRPRKTPGTKAKTPGRKRGRPRKT